jgi:hypothetical protein
MRTKTIKPDGAGREGDVTGNNIVSFDRSDIAFNARQFVLTTMPHTDPGNVPIWVRKNGNMVLRITPGYRTNLKTGEQICIGYPYGSTAFLFSFWMVTEIVTTKSRVLKPSSNLSEFLRELGLNPSGRGKKSGAAALYDQAERYLNALYTFEEFKKIGSRDARDWVNIPITAGGTGGGYQLWWNLVEPRKSSLFEAQIIVGEQFYEACQHAPIPAKMSVLRALKKSVLGLNLYAWLQREAYQVQRNDKPRFVHWTSLGEQLGCHYSNPYDLAKKVKRELHKIQENWTGLVLGDRIGGIEILPGSLPDVPMREARSVLDSILPIKQASVPTPAAWDKALAMKLERSVTKVVFDFQAAVQRGEMAATDEAFLIYCRQFASVR